MSINKKCLQGTYFDSTFGECNRCQDTFNCENCDENGCLICNNGKRPSGTRCPR